jgi:CubicO group peptidase (beta-lactamase class C family)
LKKIIGIFIVTLLITPITLATIGEQKEEDNSSLGFDDFDDEINRLMRKGHMPSLTLCYIKNDEIVFSNAYGLSDMEHNTEATADSIYMVASISKTFVATALMQLYEQDLFDLDDDVNDYLPFEVRNPNFPDDPITFRMLLAHQSSYVCRYVESIFAPFEPLVYTGTLKEGLQWGIFGLIHLYDIFSGFYNEERAIWIEEVMSQDGSFYHPEHWGNYPPGEDFYYSNVIYVL